MCSGPSGECLIGTWMPTPAPVSPQGPCKVSFVRPELRLWRPVAGVGPPEPPLCTPPGWGALAACPGESALAAVCRSDGPDSAPDRSLPTPASEQVNRLSEDFA